MADPRGFVQPPVRRPRKGGIQAVANIVTAERMFAAASLQWLSESCSFPFDAPGLCWGEVIEATKDTEGIEFGESSLIFAGYSGVACVDLTAEADFERRARLSLESGEDRFVEGKLLTHLADIYGGGTGTSATDWVNAIAIAEETADANYVGQPVLVMSRAGAVYAKAADALDGDRDGNLWTANGTPVLATSAFPPATEKYIYVTGDLTLWRSEIVATTAQTPQANTAMALAERAYALGVDCDYVDLISIGPV